MSGFLLLLLKLNLAMGGAVVLVSLLRRPLRRLFGAPIAYALWLLVPVAGLASLLPPRVVASAPLPPSAVMSVHVPAIMDRVAPSALRTAEQLPQQLMARSADLLAPPAMASPTLLLLAGWALGALLMALTLTRLQLRFAAAARVGKAGPAVLGFFNPRIVTPDGFQDHFTPQERAAILAHEHVHLARQDARINALAALLRCLCWFNPLIHLGARWLRIDQELACDASVVAGTISRRAYAEALLKSQLVVTSLPLGCNWPGSQHPLVERIALLKRKPPGAARRLAGVSMIALTASFAGLGAWAAQPPVATKPASLPRMIAPPQSMASVAAPAAEASSQSVSDAAIPATESEAARTVRAGKAPSPAPLPMQAPSGGAINARIQSALAALPGPTPVAVALNIPPRTFTTSSDAGPDDIVVANTPSGAAGDAEAIVCRAPQRMASGQLGPEVCGHNYEWLKMARNGKDLAADGKTLIDMPTVANPKGDGDPDAVTCRTPKFVLMGPLVKVCETNRFWADIAKNRQFVDARGMVRTWPSSAAIGTNWPDTGVGPRGDGYFTDSGSSAFPSSGNSIPGNAGPASP